MVIFIVGATVVGLIGYILLSDPKTKDRKIGGKASPILFKSSLKTGGVDEKEVFKTLKDAGIKPCFLDADLKSKDEGAALMDDEFDKIETPEVVKIDENTLDVSSKTSIDDLNERFDQDIPNEDFQTIGGYVFGLLGREPELGDVVEDKNITYTILELDGIKITRIKMQKNTPFIDNEENQNIEIQGE